MSKALIQQQAAKVLRERADNLLKQQADVEYARSVQQQAQLVQQQVIQIQHAQQVLQVQQAQLDLSAQTITQVNRDNAALREEVDRLIIELNDYDAATALEASIEVAEIISPLLPAYGDLTPQHGFEDYEDVSATGEHKE